MSIPNPSAYGCAQFEAGLSDYRDGTLATESAAEARRHLAACVGCRELHLRVAETLALVRGLPQVEPPARLLARIYAETLPAADLRRIHQPRRSGFAGFWAGLSSPRFALGLAMSVFAVSLLLNAAQVNLRQVSISQLSPGNLTSALQRRLDRTWARGVSYYHDLRVVYEIEAAVRQMRQPAPPPQPPTGHDHSQRSGLRPDEILAARMFTFDPVLPMQSQGRVS